MHDLDRTQLEFESEYEENEARRGCACEHGSGQVLDEVEEIELAAELLEVDGEEELEQFLGKLIRRVGKKIKKFVRSPIGGALVGALKKAAISAVPGLGAAVGALDVVRGVAKAAKGDGGEDQPEPAPSEGDAAEIFGLELEGLSPEDAEFEVAKRFVRFGAEAVNEATAAPEEAPPQAAAQSAVSRAAARHAPGLARRSGRERPQGGGGGRPGQSGRWVRRGNRILLLGV